MDVICINCNEPITPRADPSGRIWYHAGGHWSCQGLCHGEYAFPSDPSLDSDLYPVGTEVLYRGASCAVSPDVFIGRIDFVADYSGMGSHLGEVRYLVFPLARQFEDGAWIDLRARYHQWCYPDDLLIPDAS